MKKSYTSASGMKTVHYDEAGNKVGESWRGPSGRIIHYDAEGNETGRSYQNASGRMTHYGAQGERRGHSYTAPDGRMRHYHANGTHETTGRFFAKRTEPARAGCLTVLAAIAVVAWICL